MYFIVYVYLVGMLKI